MWGCEAGLLCGVVRQGCYVGLSRIDVDKPLDNSLLKQNTK